MVTGGAGGVHAARPYNMPVRCYVRSLEECQMATKSERVEARLSAEERVQIERAARFEGRSLSAFMVEAAVERADQVLADQSVTVVPAEYFDELVAALDEPDRAPQLGRAAKRAGRRARIA